MTAHAVSSVPPSSDLSPGERPRGVWSIAGETPIIVDAEGPATIVVPSEAVRLLAVDLPVRGRRQRTQALPFAVEDRIADPIDAVHLALGHEIAPRRFLVGVVRHDRMAQWIETARDLGMANAAMLPDALTLPVPPEGHWSVELSEKRALVRDADGTGFALPAPMLAAAWERAARPGCFAYGLPLPEAMDAGEPPEPLHSFAGRIASPALDLRQGAYASASSGSVGGAGRRFALILALGLAAHLAIAGGDAAMLKRIAAHREAATRALVARMAPGVTLGDDVPEQVADMIPQPTGTDRFLPLVTRISALLAPIGSDISVREMRFDHDRLTIDLDTQNADAQQRVTQAIESSGISATVSQANDGGLHIVASAR